jgi:hypothetical protein
MEGWYSKAGSKWKTMPELMLRYRAAAFFGRLYAPEILMGMKTVEEIEDVVDLEPDEYSSVATKTESKKDALKEKLKAKKEQVPEAPPEELRQAQETEVVQDAVPGEEAPPSVICPKNNESTFKSFCVAACKERAGCPAHS